MLWDSYFLHKSTNLDTLLCVLNTGGVSKEEIATQDFNRNSVRAKAIEYFILRKWI